jgi:hypothetical protein
VTDTSRRLISVAPVVVSLLIFFGTLWLGKKVGR